MCEPPKNGLKHQTSESIWKGNKNRGTFSDVHVLIYWSTEVCGLSSEVLPKKYSYISDNSKQLFQIIVICFVLIMAWAY